MPEAPGRLRSQQLCFQTWGFWGPPVVPVSGSAPLDRQGSLDSPTDANRSNLPIPRPVKSNEAAKPTIYPSSTAKAACLPGLTTAQFTPPLNEFLQEPGCPNFPPRFTQMYYLLSSLSPNLFAPTSHYPSDTSLDALGAV